MVWLTLRDNRLELRLPELAIWGLGLDLQGGIVLGSELGGNFFLGSLRWELLALSAREVGPIYTLQGR